MSNATSSSARKSPKPAHIPFAVADVSALAKSLRAAFERADTTPTQVQMLNWLAKAAGHQNYQSLKAQASAKPVAPLSVDAGPDAAESAAQVKTDATNASTPDSDTALTAHAAKALTQFDTDGKLTRWPHKFAVQRVAMWGLWIRFDAKRKYSEKDVNGVFNAWHLFGDHATLRRELVNMGLLARKPDCSVYWKQPHQPSDDIQAFLRALRKQSAV